MTPPNQNTCALLERWPTQIYFTLTFSFIVCGITEARSQTCSGSGTDFGWITTPFPYLFHQNHSTYITTPNEGKPLWIKFGYKIWSHLFLTISSQRDTEERGDRRERLAGFVSPLFASHRSQDELQLGRTHHSRPC